MRWLSPKHQTPYGDRPRRADILGDNMADVFKSAEALAEALSNNVMELLGHMTGDSILNVLQGQALLEMDDTG